MGKDLIGRLYIPLQITFLSSKKCLNAWGLLEKAKFNIIAFSNKEKFYPKNEANDFYPIKSPSAPMNKSASLAHSNIILLFGCAHSILFSLKE